MALWIKLSLGSAVALVAGAAMAATQSLTILHDNDIHGHLRSFCYVEIAKVRTSTATSVARRGGRRW